MNFQINEKTVRHISNLAKLYLSDDEMDKAKLDMQRMLEYADELGTLDTSGIELSDGTSSDENVFREDVIVNENGLDDLLANAPEQKDNMIQVPKTI